MNMIFEEAFTEEPLEDIRSITHSVMKKFREIAEQIRPTFEELDSWRTTNHKKLDESQKLHDDFEDLQQYINSLKNATSSFFKASKPIKNITRANTLLEAIAEYVKSINNEVKSDGFEVSDGNNAEVFTKIQNKYCEFIAEMNDFYLKCEETNE